MYVGMDRLSWHPSATTQVPPTVLSSQSHHLVRSVLATWTGVLIILVVSASRTIPPVVLAFFLPYLALVAWHLLALQGRAGKKGRIAIPEDSATRPRPDIDPAVATSAPSASLDNKADSSDVCGSNPAPGAEPQPSTTVPVRSRRRFKPKAVPEPTPASWVQVGPGRFVRGEEAQPSPGSSVEVESMAHAPETPPDLADDAATEGLVVGDPAGLPEVPVTAPAASQPGDAPVHFHDDEDHVPMVEAVLAEPGAT
jgi:hypothetical protein